MIIQQTKMTYLFEYFISNPPGLQATVIVIAMIRFC